jgi:hypothetical protein
MASYASRMKGCYPPATTINTLGAIPIYNQNLIEMEKDNILNFQDFVLEDSKKSKHETKKSKPIKKREEFVEDMEDDIVDPNDNPERYVKLREQFIKENYK